MQKARGFTLLNLVLALTVVLLSALVVVPMLGDAWRQAEVSDFVKQVNAVKHAIAVFYRDTGQLPTHESKNEAHHRKQLTRNNPANLIPGWKGPYLSEDFRHPFQERGYLAVLASDDANFQFDLDGDGVVDTTRVTVIRIDNISDTQARTINDVFDLNERGSHGDQMWQSAGRVKRYGMNSDHPSRLLIYVAQIAAGARSGL